MINKELNNNLFDYLYERNNCLYTFYGPISDDEKNAICKVFYVLLPFIMGELSKRQREVIILKYGGKKNQLETSKILKISQSNVSLHLSVAYKIFDRYFNIILRGTLLGLRYEKEKD